MPDIFLSYSREDQLVARWFANAFEREGFSVWWDATLRSGEAYDKVTEEALSQAKAVVVLWSPRSVDSRWVRAEATQADRNGTLVPVMIEPCKRPIMFELTHTADLVHWKGDSGDKAWRSFLSDVRAFVGREKPAGGVLSPVSSTAAPRHPVRRPVIAGAVALVFFAGIAVALFLLQGRAPVAQRTAFFGFTTGSSDPVAVQMASSATDETFKTMNALGLETVSSGQTSNIARADQLARARELGALYALSGEVAATGDGYALSIRLDDVLAQRTLWQDNAPAAAAVIPASIEAAAKATSVLRCFAATRTNLKRENDRLLGVLTQACAKGDAVAADNLEAVAAWRELAELAGESAYVQGYFARRILRVLNQQQLATPVRQAMLEEARIAAQRAVRIDRGDGNAVATLAYLSVVDGRPRAEAERILIDGLKVAPTDGALNAYYQNFLVGSGRYRFAMPYAFAAAQNDPLRPTFIPAMVLANAGRPLEARRVFEEYNARLGDPVPWSNWAHAAIFAGLDDVAHVFEAVPPSVSADTVACWRDIAAAAASGDRVEGTLRVKACVLSRSIDQELGFQALAGLGDVDGAYALVNNEAADRNNPIGFTRAPVFSLSTRSMRADARFLLLVKERGIWDYWIDTGVRPDVCDLPAEQDFEVCVALAAAQADR